jgi:Protein of unknown function (DUF1573)
MKIASVIWLALAASLHAAGLNFKETRQEFHAPADATVVTRDFEFTNTSEKAVTIRKYDAACSCMAVKIKEGKLRYEPGESGVVRAEFDMGNFSGEVDKSVTLWVDSDPDDKPSIVLTVHVIIPVLVSVEPKTLKWEVDAKPDPQIIRINTTHSQPIRVTSVTCSSEAYSHELKTVTEGKVYELLVTPLDMKTPGLAIFRITTDSKINKFKVAQAYAQVRKPTPSTAGGKQ